MLEKPFLKTVLSKIRHGGLKVTYWDGETATYGRDKPKVHLTFRDPSLVREARKSLEMAIGEGYMDGRIEVVGDLKDLARLGDENQVELAEYMPLLARKALKRRRANRKREWSDVQHHYDLGNDFYALWLDKSMTYSCAYFRRPSDSLEQAQKQKIDHILRKLCLKRGMTLLDIGSGWGQLILRAAQQYGVKAHGITLSKEQYAKTKQRIKELKLSKLVSVELKHYDELTGSRQYDRVVSVGMYEHVGKENHAKYMAAACRTLKPGGLSMLHTITQFIERPMSPWTDKYIFPGGYLPTIESIYALLPQYDFHPLDDESLRRHYAKTLDEWYRRFKRHESEVRNMYDNRFIRMWSLYLRGSYAGFAYGNLDLHQVLFSKGLVDNIPPTRDHIYQ